MAGWRAERKAVEARRDNIPTELHAARAVLAEAAGLTPDDLPFVGELIEVRTEFEPWREAFNLALGGFATRMLIDTGMSTPFREAINAVPPARRIRFEGVPTGLRDEVGLDDRTLPGRLDYRPSPFTAWLKSELAGRFDFVCVETPRLLGQYPKALTITGQTSERGRGAHGGHGRANLLGFTNNSRSPTWRTGSALRGNALTSRRLGVEGGGGPQLVRDPTYGLPGPDRACPGTRWTSCRSRLNETAGTASSTEVRAGNPRIDQLQRQLDELTKRVTTDRTRRPQKDNLKDLGEPGSDRRRGGPRPGGTRPAAETGADVSQEHRAYLEALFEATRTAPTRREALAEFDAAVNRATERLRADRQSAAETIGRSRKALLDTFSTFLERWPNPNLGTDPDASYRDFDRLLADLETSGLHELEAEWRDSLLKLSGNDLTGLDSELAAAVREIRDRIDPVNRILDELPFADDDHRLRIDPQESHSAVRARFRKELREVRAFIDKAATDDDRERAYHPDGPR